MTNETPLFFMQLKVEVEKKWGSKMRMSFIGGLEAHLIAKELGEHEIGVILDPPRSFPITWSGRRVIDGPPLTKETDVTTLLSHNVTVGLGRGLYPSQAKNTRFNMAWSALEADGKISREQAYALVSTNIEKILGLDDVADGGLDDLVAFDGGSAFEYSSKVVAVLSHQRGFAEVFSG